MSYEYNTLCLHEGCDNADKYPRSQQRAAPLVTRLLVFTRRIASAMVYALLLTSLSLRRRLESAMEDAQARKDKAEALATTERAEVSLLATQRRWLAYSLVDSAIAVSPALS